MHLGILGARKLAWVLRLRQHPVPPEASRRHRPVSSDERVLCHISDVQLLVRWPRHRCLYINRCQRRCVAASCREQPLEGRLAKFSLCSLCCLLRCLSRSCLTPLPCVFPRNPRARGAPSGLHPVPSMSTNPTVDDLEKKEEELFRTGPLSVLTTSVKTNSQVRCAPHTPARGARAPRAGRRSADGAAACQRAGAEGHAGMRGPRRRCGRHGRPAGADQLQKQPETARPRQGLRPALQHDPGERQGVLDRGAGARRRRWRRQSAQPAGLWCTAANVAPGLAATTGNTPWRLTLTPRRRSPRRAGARRAARLSTRTASSPSSSCAETRSSWYYATPSDLACSTGTPSRAG